jgi:phage tail-like protein
MGARTQLDDSLLSHQFHLIDVDMRPPFNPPFVLWPAAGFSSITAPEVTVETEEISEGTSDYTYKVLKRASVSDLSLAKGVSMFNTDFWRWITGALSGKNEVSLGLTANIAPVPPARRRNLMLLQSSGLSVRGIIHILESGTIMEKINAATLLPAAAASSFVSESIDMLTQGVFDLGMLAVPGRAYMLFDCLPIRYKVGTDFSALEASVSIEELDLSYTRFEVFGSFGR